ITSLSVGSHTVTASYSGDRSFAGSSGTLASGQTVDQASTSTGLVSSANPALFGQTLTFTATVSIGDPGAGMATGTVQFQIDGSDAASPLGVSTSGPARPASDLITSLAVGSHTVTASYSGDTSLTASSTAVAQTVNKASSTTLMASSVNP